MTPDYTAQLDELIQIASNLNFLGVSILFAIGIVVGYMTERALIPWNK